MSILILLHLQGLTPEKLRTHTHARARVHTQACFDLCVGARTGRLEVFKNRDMVYCFRSVFERIFSLARSCTLGNPQKSKFLSLVEPQTGRRGNVEHRVLFLNRGKKEGGIRNELDSSLPRYPQNCKDCTGQ